MKKLFKFALSAALGVVAFVGCQKENEAVQPNGNENLVNVTLIAGTPETRTEMDADNKLYWSGKDVIGVTDNVATNGDFANYNFTNNSETASTTAAFEGSTVTGTLYAYYPYTSNGVNDKGAKVDIPATQSPTVNSFDGKADVLISKPFTVTEPTTEVSGLEFRRLTGIVKVVLKNDKLATEHLSSLAMTAENDLVGRVYVDFAKFDIGDDGIYNAAKTVTANYTEETEFEVNGTNAVYYSVVPTTLAAGSTLIFTGSTESYAIEKTITLPNDIAIEAGKITTLNITLGDNNIEGSAGLALPFEDDFSWLEGVTKNTSTVLALDDYPANYSATQRTYKNAVGELKFGTGDYRGTFTTTELNLSEVFTVVVKAKTYGTDKSTLSVTAGSATLTSAALTSDYKEDTFEFDSQGKSTVSVKINGKRGYVSEFKVIAGHNYVLPPVLNITSDDVISGVAASGDVGTIEYNIENPVAGTSVVASANVDWINTFDYTVENEVSFVVDQNAGDSREGIITLTYGTQAKTVTVVQDAAPVVGEATVEFVVADFENNTASKDGVDATFAKGGGNNTVYSTDHIRMYGGNTLTISSTKTIKKIVFDCQRVRNLTVDSGTYTYTGELGSNGLGTWVTGEAAVTKVVFNNGTNNSTAQSRIAKITVTYVE